ncbi:helix-turn-helix domain-containing protein [Streptomyces sp. NPDC046931]|uniref:helix-turn-helix domain-containing protein n=1 Tax=Streptomyces sp. NPDC046931 TaxID=3154806 RepID=UPI0033D86A0B
MECSACPRSSEPPATGTPEPGTAPGVLRYRGFVLGEGQPCGHLEPPADAVCLMVLFRGRVTLGSVPGGPVHPAAYDAAVCGLRTHALLSRHGPTLAGVDIALAPWAAYRLFGVPMSELSERVTDAHELLGGSPPGLEGLALALASLPGWPDRFALLDRWLTRLMADGPRPAPHITQAWQRLTRGPMRMPVAQLARDVGWSQSQLERRFVQQIGVTPKTAARIVRLRRSLGLLSRGRPAAEVAVLAGYYDQAHFSREIKTMTGSPARLLQKCAHCSEFLQDRSTPRPAQYFSPVLVR